MTKPTKWHVHPAKTQISLLKNSVVIELIKPLCWDRDYKENKIPKNFEHTKKIDVHVVTLKFEPYGFTVE